MFETYTSWKREVSTFQLPNCEPRPSFILTYFNFFVEMSNLFFQTCLKANQRHFSTCALNRSISKLISLIHEPIRTSPKVLRKKDFLPLQQAKRQKRPKDAVAESLKLPGHWNVVAYSTAEEYDLSSLASALKRQDLYYLCELTNDDILYSGLGNALHAIAKYKVSNENRHIYYFQEGTVVIWNCSEIEQHAIVDFIRPFELKDYDKHVVLSEIEEMSFAYEENSEKTFIDNGIMHIGTKNRSNEDISSDRYTLSNAMALSVKLGILETLLNQYIQTIEPVTQELRNGLPVSITQRGVLRKSGELFVLRHSVSLSMDFLDIPDFYWDRENLEGLYNLSCAYFSITRRTKVLNEKLNHCLELITLVSTHLSDRHHVRLEWMIIILIMVEVGFEVLHFMKS